MTTSRLQERPVASRSSRIRVLATSLLVAAAVPVIGVQASEPPLDARPPAVIGDRQGSVQPTIQYEEALAHAGDRIPFTPGERVTVPFKPRGSDRWTVADEPPRSLPAGRLSGPRDPGRRGRPALRPEGLGHGRVEPGGRTRRPALGRTQGGELAADLAAAVNPGGLRREVFGFLPYWELTDPSTRLDWVEALDDRLLRGRRRRQRGPPAQEHRRIDDRRLERLDELEADRRHQCRARQRRAGRADRPELRLVVTA